MGCNGSMGAAGVLLGMDGHSANKAGEAWLKGSEGQRGSWAGDQDRKDEEAVITLPPSNNIVSSG